MNKPIDFTTITACGECCVGCKKKEEGICQGCIESDGHCVEWAQSNGCPIHKCAMSFRASGWLRKSFGDRMWWKS